MGDKENVLKTFNSNSNNLEVSTSQVWGQFTLKTHDDQNNINNLQYSEI